MMRGGPSPARRGARSAFTLIELTVSLVVMSVLVGALASSVVVATHAMPRPDDRAAAVSRGATQAGRIVAELQEARHLSEHTRNAVTFTVADRDGDGSPERIRYAWSGTPGDPLVREYGDGDALVFAEDVHVFDLDFETAAADETYPGVVPSTAEAMLALADGHDDEVFVQKTYAIGQYIDPAELLPPEAVGWTLTKVAVSARRQGTPNGVTSVEIRPATDGGTPSDHVLAQELLPETDLVASYTWRELALDDRDLVDLSPKSAICLVLRWHESGKGDVASFHYSTSQGSGRLESLDGGSSWRRAEAGSLRYALWGTYSVAGATQTVTRRFVVGVEVALQVGPDSNARIETAAHMLNPTETLSGYWELGFDADPRDLDVNADRIGDWESYSAPFDAGDLVDSIWYAPDNGVAGIRTAPNGSFAELTTVELTGRASCVGSYGAALWMNVDPKAGAAAGLIAGLHKPDAASQELWIGNERGDGSDPWLVIHEVPDDLVDVRLVIDPKTETFAVFVDGTHRSTHPYVRGVGGSAKKAWLYTHDCTGEFDHVSIKVIDRD
jgi:prepilin-type N-terminal cleavage/methylation domain-containing protein